MRTWEQRMSQDQRRSVGRIHLKPLAVRPEDLVPPQNAPKPEPAAPRAPNHAAPSNEVIAALSAKHGVPGLDVAQLRLALTSLRSVPRVVALLHKLLPFEEGDTTLDVVMVDPQNKKAIDELEFVTGKTVRVHVAPEPALMAFLRGAYDAMEAGESHYGAEDLPAVAPAPAPAPRPPPASPPAAPRPAPAAPAQAPAPRPAPAAPPAVPAASSAERPQLPAALSAPTRTRRPSSSRTPVSAPYSSAPYSSSRGERRSTPLPSAKAPPIRRTTPAPRGAPPRRPVRDLRSDDDD
ncbi:MAG: hypothetical protein U0414_10230 [Polyangiaceae bacterium]